MITSSPLEKALPGRENAKDWLTLKIVECLSVPMDDETAKKLTGYNGAYNAVCQWGEDQNTKIEFQEEDKKSSSFSLDTAKEWTSKMQNADGTQGPHWTLEQAKQIIAQRKISVSPVEFWVTMCMLYSDFSPVIKKHGIGGNLDFYVDMAKAFLQDKDAKPDKVMRYYENIVK